MSYNSLLEDKRIKEMQLPDFLICILRRLRENGHSAYIVGGAIRDACLQREIMDWDVTTSASKLEIQKIFSNTRHFSLKHDTITLVDNKTTYEVTPLRTLAGSADIQTDLGHRDFTINALAYDPVSEVLIDPYEGRADLKKKLIRAVGKPGERFKEDPLRLLRAIRLASELHFNIETETWNAISLLAPKLHDIAQERIRDELVKLLMSPTPSLGFRLMRNAGLLQIILPELLEGYRKQQNMHHRFTIYRHILETIDMTEPVLLIRLTALFHDIAKPRVRKKSHGVWRFIGHEQAGANMAREIMKRLRFSNDDIRDVIHLVKHHMINYDSTWSDGAVRRFLRRIGSEHIDNLISFRKADFATHGKGPNRPHDILGELEERLRAIRHGAIVGMDKPLAINGKIIMGILGIGPGPEVGRIIGDLIERVTDRPELNNERDLIRILRREYYS
jgi:poly(A) polymerase/tRNA nucleotidyltransferase (CCA-adding enzyme)